MQLYEFPNRLLLGLQSVLDLRLQEKHFVNIPLFQLLLDLVKLKHLLRLNNTLCDLPGLV